MHFTVPALTAFTFSALFGLSLRTILKEVHLDRISLEAVLLLRFL